MLIIIIIVRIAIILVIIRRVFIILIQITKNQGRGLKLGASIGLPAMGRSWRPANGSGKAGKREGGCPGLGFRV